MENPKTETPIKTLEEILAEMLTAPDTAPSPAQDAMQRQIINDAVTTLHEQAREVLAICDAEQDFLENTPPLANGAQLRTEFADSLTKLLLDMEETLYINSATVRPSKLEMARYTYAQKGKFHSHIDIHYSNERILIRMPYLPKRYSGTVDAVNNALAAKIYETDNFPFWPNWTANYYHVFPTDVKSIPKDVDNYDYKRTNDLLAFTLGTCDNPLHFSMSMTTVFTDQLKPGVYIEIKPKSSENIDFLVNTFGSPTHKNQ